MTLAQSMEQPSTPDGSARHRLARPRFFPFRWIYSP